MGAEQPRREHDAHAVGGREVGIVEHRAKRPVVPRLHDELGVDRDHVVHASTLIIQEALQNGCAFSFAASVDLYTQYTNFTQAEPSPSHRKYASQYTPLYGAIESAEHRYATR